MRPIHRPVLAVLLSGFTATACSHTPLPSPEPRTVTVTVYPAMPDTKCARAPTPPSVDASDREWAAYKKARDNAGDECRDKLDAVDAAVKAWPR